MKKRTILGKKEKEITKPIFIFSEEALALDTVFIGMTAILFLYVTEQELARNGITEPTWWSISYGTLIIIAILKNLLDKIRWIILQNRKEQKEEKR